MNAKPSPRPLRPARRAEGAGRRHHLAANGWLATAVALILVGLALGASTAEAREYEFAGELNPTEIPARNFDDPCGLAVDPYGDVYVATAAIDNGLGEAGHIDVFDSEGHYIDGATVPDRFQPCSLSVDSKGNLYVVNTRNESGERFVLYEPTTYQPALGLISYPSTPSKVLSQAPGISASAVDPATDEVYVRDYATVTSYSSAESGSVPGPGFTLTSPNVSGADHESIRGGWGLAYSVRDGRLYAPVFVENTLTIRVLRQAVMSYDPATGQFEEEFGGPAELGGFHSGGLGAALATAADTGEIFVGEVAQQAAVWAFESDGDFLGALKHSLKESNLVSAIAVDNSGGPRNGYVYVTSGSDASGKVLAFAPVPEPTPPLVRGEAVSGITQTEALLEGEVQPNGLATSYRFEYGTGDCAASPCVAIPMPDAGAGSGLSFGAVRRAISGLDPGTTYHYRLVASSHCEPEAPEAVCETDGEDRTFSTYPSAPTQHCPNEDLRTGPSTRLPDCRAYELVTPPETNGRTPTATVFGAQGSAVGGFPFPLAAQAGDALAFGVEGGTIPGASGNGFYDTYESARGGDGWSTRLTAPVGSQATQPLAGGLSGDHRYSFWETFSKSEGSLGGGAAYLRRPDGGFEPTGVGSLGVTSEVLGDWISEGGRVIFSTCARVGETDCTQLEPDAPPSGTGAIYERSPDGPTRVVSLLPGDVTPLAGQRSYYEGVSADGAAIAFRIGSEAPSAPSSQYIRRNAETLELGSGQLRFAGLSRDGLKAFYLDVTEPEPFRGGPPAGRLFVCELETGGCAGPESHPPVQIGLGEEETVVNISADGSHVYFATPEILTGAEENAQGKRAQAGEPNLYVWSGGKVRFIATVTERDMRGDIRAGGGAGNYDGGLGQWVGFAAGASPGQTRLIGPGKDPSRSTADGSVFVFESAASLAGYDSNGHDEVYRYAAGSGGLECVSCNPTGQPATSDAHLQSRLGAVLQAVPPTSAIAEVGNLSADGKTVFFQSEEALVADDADGKLDAYRWHEGEVALLSSPRSEAAEYLYAASPSGRDAFILTTEELLPEDHESTASIYDARVGGGFPPAEPTHPCQGEGCQSRGGGSGQPTLGPASAGIHGQGNVTSTARKRCAEARRHRGARCARRHPRKHRAGHRGHRRRNHKAGRAGR